MKKNPTKSHKYVVISMRGLILIYRVVEIGPHQVKMEKVFSFYTSKNWKRENYVNLSGFKLVSDAQIK